MDTTSAATATATAVATVTAPVIIFAGNTSGGKRGETNGIDVLKNWTLRL